MNKLENDWSYSKYSFTKIEIDGVYIGIYFNYKVVIKDLKDRLKARKPFTPPLEGIGFEYGFNTKTLDSWATYWMEKYNFTERENFFNQYPHFRTKIQGLNIHFIRVTPEVPPGKHLVPILLLHGWPGSVREFYEAIPYLTAASKDRDFVLELIIPSLPGYGHSEGAVKPGMGPLEIAVIFRNLMQRLRFQKYYVQGGDWGSLIAANIATLFPNVGSAWLSRKRDLLNDANCYLLRTLRLNISTLRVALTDSPSGLMAYILEKFSTWTRREFRSKVDGGLEFRFTKDQLIDNLMMYWSTRSITTSMRLYSECFNKRNMAFKMDEIPTTVPTWTIQAKNELGYLPPWLIKLKYPNLIKDNPIDDGGHFLAFERPQVFSEDVLNAVQAFRQWHKKSNVKTDL
ncbi:unnamed protein product [Diatraea saccharalis]|uniref:Epoxide hydrolase n=1 Tax=Diatraea saccharalis TaxID=40085 RepID=A0A9N9WFA0_9NEOP|nr:unnamed protein product [Diatraea saccharalis]